MKNKRQKAKSNRKKKRRTQKPNSKRIPDQSKVMYELMIPSASERFRKEMLNSCPDLLSAAAVH